jgi:hypothetical protein
MDDWDLYEAYTQPGSPLELADLLAELFFLSDNRFTPEDAEFYNQGYLETEDWWPLVNQLLELADLEAILELAEELEPLLDLGGLPTELLEAPLEFLASVLTGHLPRQASGRKVGSRKLVEIALKVVYLAQELPDVAQAAVRAWAETQRTMLHPLPWDMFPDTDEALDAFLEERDLPVAVTGFSLLIGLTLMEWPDRAEGMPMPPMFDDPDVYTEMLTRWTELPDDPGVREEGAGEAEALFAQAQLAFMLAQLGEPEELDLDEFEDEEDTLAYSRLSRAIMWVHHKCRHCPEREEVTCKVATIRPERPVPLLDVASEVANTGRIAGCIQM